MPIITIAGILVQGDRVLLGKRLSSVPFYPALWHAPTGYLQDDETIEQALRREMSGLLGIVVQEFEFFDTVYHDDSLSSEQYIHNIYFIYRWEGEPQNLAPHLHEELGWFSAEEVVTLAMAEEMRQGVLAVLESLWL